MSEEETFEQFETALTQMSTIMGEYYNAKEIRMKQEITQDLNTLFELIDRFSGQLLGDVLATEDTAAGAIGLALLLVRTQTQTGKE